MMKSKKANFSEIFVSVISLGILMAMAIFGYLFVHNLWVAEVLPVAENATLAIIETNGNDSVIRNLIIDQTDKMSALEINLDLIFMALWVGTTIFFITLAYFLPPISKFEFLTFIFIGIMLILFWLNFVEQLFSWYVTTFILNVFTSSETNLPIFTFYLENYISIVIMTMVAVMLTNQFSRKPEPAEMDIAEETFRDEVEEGQFQDAEFEESQLDSEGNVK